MTTIVGAGLVDPWAAELGQRFGVTALGEGDDAAAEILITRGYPVDDRLLPRLPALKLVLSLGAGYDAVDCAALARKGIQLATSPGRPDRCVADHAWALMLAAARRVPEADRYARSGAWEAGPFGFGRQVSGHRLGVLGLGRIGAGVARRGAGFDMEVGYWSRSARPDSAYRYFAEPVSLAAWADYLVVACAATPETRHIANRAVFEALGPDGIVVNVARGSVLDEAALAAALAEGRIGGAGLDVFEHEPAVPKALAADHRVVLTPHIGGRTDAHAKAILNDLVANIESWRREGRPLYQVA